MEVDFKVRPETPYTHVIHYIMYWSIKGLLAKLNFKCFQEPSYVSFLILQILFQDFADSDAYTSVKDFPEKKLYTLFCLKEDKCFHKLTPTCLSVDCVVGFWSSNLFILYNKELVIIRTNKQVRKKLFGTWSSLLVPLQEDSNLATFDSIYHSQLPHLQHYSKRK